MKITISIFLVLLSISCLAQTAPPIGPKPRDYTTKKVKAVKIKKPVKLMVKKALHR